MNDPATRANSSISSPSIESETLPGVLSSSLPYPDLSTLNISPGQRKKSHARKRPAGHIPRPRNAFILFRCDFVRQKKVPDYIEANHRNISRIVGAVWKNMSASQKAPWFTMAGIEKRNHAQTYPGYKFRPGYENRGRELRIKNLSQSPAASGGSEIHSESPRWTLPLAFALPPSFTPPIVPLRRTSSCPPPGALPILSPASLGQSNGDLGSPAPLTTRDDLARRPSRAVMYHSNVPLNSFSSSPSLSTVPPPGSVVDAPLSSDWWPTDPTKETPLMSGPYSIVPPRDAPGWDAAPTRPDAWNSWSPELPGSQIQQFDRSTSSMNLITDWNPGGKPTFTNPFLSAPSASDNSLPWNLDPSTMVPLGNATGPGPMTVDTPPPGLSSDSFAPVDDNGNMPTLSSEGYHSVDDLGNLLKARLSLVEHDGNEDSKLYISHQFLRPREILEENMIPHSGFISDGYLNAIAGRHPVSNLYPYRRGIPISQSPLLPHKTGEETQDDTGAQNRPSGQPLSNDHNSSMQKDWGYSESFDAIPSSAASSSNVEYTSPPTLSDDDMSRLTRGLQQRDLTPERFHQLRMENITALLRSNAPDISQTEQIADSEGSGKN